MHASEDGLKLHITKYVKQNANLPVQKEIELSWGHAYLWQHGQHNLSL
jgi:hypothetical protein